MLDSNMIKSCFSISDVKIISFDIFDTLVERPALYQTDIFILLNNIVKKIVEKKDFNFYSIRKNVEARAREYYQNKGIYEGEITFRQIYDYFGKAYRFSEEQVRQIADEEIKLEKSLLTVRPAGRSLYESALASGKKIICISDMYLDRSTLKDILEVTGYNHVEEIYVSSEIKKRKDTGDLFDYVLEKEGVAPYCMVHVGDNYVSDVKIPLKKGITAHHLPSARMLFFNSKTRYGRLWSSVEGYSPYERMIMGFTINRWPANILDAGSIFPGKKHLGYLGIGPVLFSIAQYLKTNQEIQKEYAVLHFASRDGFLPRQAYDLLCGDTPSGFIPSHYLYCGRLLYNIAHYNSNPDRYFHHRVNKTILSKNMTMGNLFDALCLPGFLSNDENRRHIRLMDDRRQKYRIMKEILHERKVEISSVLDRKKKNVTAYYLAEICFSDKGRAIVFDCGYGGSVSETVTKLTGKKIDKAYLWETSSNRKCDRINRTRTFLLGSDISRLKKKGIWLVLEELFSSLENSCIDIEYGQSNCRPVFDRSRPLSEETREDLIQIQKNAIAFVHDIKKQFNHYISDLVINDISFSLEPLEASMMSMTDMSISCLKRIVLPDSFYSDFRPLSEKIEPEGSEFLHRTNFVNRNCMVSKPLTNNQLQTGSIGIHVHLFYIEQSPIFIERLKTLENPFDLLISVCSDKDRKIARILFNRKVLPLLRNIVLKTVSNRGRDVAPWLVGFKSELDQYQYICHVHSKKSPHFGWGEQWRDYLLDNLITKESVLDIIAHFESDKNIGLIFPPIYKELVNIWTRVSHIEDIDRQNCEKILRKAGINQYITKQMFHFSPGTMFWYRREALLPLHHLNLTEASFPEEPVSITGSYAHAIERIPSIIAKSQGYRTFCYIRQSDLINSYHKKLFLMEGESRTETVWELKNRLLAGIRKVMIAIFPVGTIGYRLSKKIYDRLRENAH